MIYRGKKHRNADGLSQVPCNKRRRVETEGEAESMIVVVVVVGWWCAKFGTPRALHSDQGCPFESKVMAEVA